MSRPGRGWIALGLILVGMIGCGGGPKVPDEVLVPVEGTVTIEGEPYAGVAVSFIPTGNNVKSHRGSGVTDSEGRFEMLNYKHKQGLPAGEYAVYFNLMRMPDGSEPPADKPLVLSGAVEMIDPTWSNLAVVGRHNTVTVPAEGKTDFEFKIPKKK